MARDSSSDGVPDLDDVDEDGNPVVKKPVPQKAIPIEPPEASTGAALVAAGPSPLIRPQGTSGGTTLAILAQHFDMPQEFATFLREFDSAFLKGDYLFGLDVNAYWKVKYGLDHLVALIAGQVDTDKSLRVQMPMFLRDYFAIEDAAEDRDDEIQQKVFQLSKLVKVAGLGTKDAAKPLPITPPEAMRLRIRKELEPWQETPDEGGVLQIAERVVQSIQRRRLMIMIVDVDPYAGIAFGGGKSQLLYQILYWTYFLLGKTFDARKDTVYRQDRARFERMFRELEEVPTGVDEINQFFDMWAWQNPANQWLVHQVEMYRKTGRPIIGACGQIWILNKRFREVIITHRLSVTKWDDDAFVGEATLFKKWGPPAAQDEKENKWGMEDVRFKFAGLKPKAFQFYSDIVKKTQEVEDSMSMDAYLKAHPNWLVDRADADELVQVRAEPVAEIRPESQEIRP